MYDLEILVTKNHFLADHVSLQNPMFVSTNNESDLSEHEICTKFWMWKGSSSVDEIEPSCGWELADWG
jgi:hypothetical protein